MNNLKPEKAKDRDIQILLGTLLRVGVLLSISVVLVGGVIFLSSHHHQIADFKVFKPEGYQLANIDEIFKGLLSLKGDAIIQFGILMLIFTPVARIILAIFSFLYERDYLYVGIGIVVLSIITISLSGGFAH